MENTTNNEIEDIEFYSSKEFKCYKEKYPEVKVLIKVAEKEVNTGYCSFTFEDCYNEYKFKDVPDRYDYWKYHYSKKEEAFIGINPNFWAYYNPSVHGFT